MRNLFLAAVLGAVTLTAVPAAAANPYRDHRHDMQKCGRIAAATCAAPTTGVRCATRAATAATTCARRSATSATICAANSAVSHRRARPGEAGAGAMTFSARRTGSRRRHDAGESGKMAPVERLAQKRDHEEAEDDQRDRFLHDLELTRTPAMGIADPVGRNGEAIFDQREFPADQDDEQERPAHAALEVPVPGDGHE